MMNSSFTSYLRCCVLSLVLASACPVLAQVAIGPEGAWYVSCGAGALMYEGDEEVEDGAVAALRLGYFRGETWGFEGALHIAPELSESTVGFTEVDPDTGEVTTGRRPVADAPFGDTYAMGIAADCLYHFVHWERVVPYLTLGVGFIWYGDEVNGETFDPSVRVGAGVRYQFNDRWAIRLDGRMLGAGNDTEANASIDAGIMWAWNTH